MLIRRDAELNETRGNDQIDAPETENQETHALAHHARAGRA